MNTTATNTHPAPHDPEQLLRDLAWVQRLAFRLCSNAALAEDLRQEAAMAALGSKVPTEGPTRRWLAGVVHKRLLMVRRSGARRTAREASAALPEALAEGVDVVERAETQALVSEAVLGLSEPYRTAILQRYFDEWTPAEIAERTGSPIDTVKSRLKRGLEQLEYRLGKRLGVADGDVRNSSGWYGVLLPLAVMESKRRAKLAGVAGSAAMSTLPWLSSLTLAMSFKVLALTLVLLTLFHFLRNDADLSPAAPVIGVSLVGDATQVAADLTSATSTPRAALATANDDAVRGSVAATDTIAADSNADAGLDLAVVTGRVIDSLGRPVVGARVRSRVGAPMPLSARGPSVSVVETDDAGRFRLETTPGEPGALWLHFDAGRFQSPAYLEFGARNDGSRLPLVPGHNDVGAVVLERAGAIRGRVFDTDGRPAAGAIVEIIGEQEVQTDRSGSFELVGLHPMQADVRAYSKASLVEEQSIFITPMKTLEGLEFRLRPAPVLEGLVVDESGAPVQGARVQMESVDDILVRSTISDASGMFRLDFTHLGEAELTVEADGYESWDASDADQTIEPNSTAVRVELKRAAVVEDGLDVAGSSDAQMTPSTVAGGVLLGRILRDGAPAQGAFLNVEAGTRMGERLARLRGYGSPDEFLVTGTVGPLIQVAADGTFRIEGLAPGLYRLTVSSWSTTTFELPVQVLRGAELLNLGDIEIPDGGTVRGHVLLPPGVSPLGLEVTCGRGFGEVRGLLDDGTRFELRGVPVGQQQVVLAARAGVLDDGGEVTVDVTSGATSDVVIDATALGLVELRLRFDLGDEARDADRVLLCPVDDPKTVLLYEFLDTEGRVCGFVRSAGEVSVHLVNHNLDHVQGPAWKLRLAAGQSIDETLAFQSGTLVLDLGPGRRVPNDGELCVRLQTADGAATSEFRVEFEDGEPLDLAESFARWTQLRDGTLRLELAQVPVGSFDVTATMLDLDVLTVSDLDGVGEGAAVGEVWLDGLRVTVPPR